MHPSSCPRCHGPVDPGFRFCKNCGCDLAYPYQPPAQPGYPQQGIDSGEKQGINLLLLAIGIKYASILLSSLLVRFLVSWGSYGAMSILNGIFALVTVAGLLVFAIMAKNKRVKLFLWIFFGVEILLVIYRFALSSMFGLF